MPEMEQRHRVRREIHDEVEELLGERPEPGTKVKVTVRTIDGETDVQIEEIEEIA